LGKLAGYTRVERSLEDFEPTLDYVVIAEELERLHASIIIPPASNTTIGLVLKAGPLAVAAGVAVNDRVMFAQWEGGRWAMLDEGAADGVVRCLIMRTEHVLARVED